MGYGQIFCLNRYNFGTRSKIYESISKRVPISGNMLYLQCLASKCLDYYYYSALKEKYNHSNT